MLIRRSRRMVAFAAGFCLVATPAVVSIPTAHAAVTACRVDYVVQNEWPGGFTANVTITNLGEATNGWQLTWTFPAGQQVQQGWNGSYQQSGAQVTVSDAGWNAALSAGASTTTGFNGSWEGSNPAPASFALNGVTCTGAVPPTTVPPTTVPPTTTPPTTTPPTTPSNDECGSGSFHAEAVLSGGTWTARNGSRVVYTGSDMRAAMQAAVDSLTRGRTSKERVLVRGSGSMSAGSRLSLPSYTLLEVCGTVDVVGSGSGDQAVVYARGVTDVEVTHLRVTGSPLYGIFVRNGTNITLGQLDLRLSSGLGVRIDNHGDRSVRTRNVKIDNVYVSGTSSHGVETYGVDGLTVGTVTARDTGYSGLILNDTINATVGKVDAQGAGTGTGYAAFRMANRNGRVGNSYPVNIRVGEVIARGGGRGIFCVSESGGAVIDRVDIAQTGNNAVLIENCYNVTLAGQSGSVAGPGDIRIAARSEFPNTSDVTIQNLTLTNSAINENPCGVNIVVRNINRVNSSLNVCSGTAR